MAGKQRSGWSGRGAALALALVLGGCATASVEEPLGAGPSHATLAPAAASQRGLVGLPAPKGRITASVYSFRDQTGQYKPAPDSSFSTAVSQGAASLLIKALTDSEWFIAVEREGLQNLLTERRIIRAAEGQGNGTSPPNLSGLLPASIVLEGGVVAYETNVRTGGAGVRYFGIGASEQYRTDQVTVNLRAVDVRSGAVLANVSTTKTILSRRLDTDVFHFVRFKRLLEAEVGYSRNEPAQLCLADAVEAAVVHLIVQGVRNGHWSLANPQDRDHPVFKAYVAEQAAQFGPQTAVK